MSHLAFVVLGVARPKGSTKAFMPKGARFPVVTSDNQHLKGWEASVRFAIQQHAGGVFFAGAVSVRIAFELPKPKRLSRRAMHHVTKPDLDKLARGALDAMKGVIWADDSQVVDLHVVKGYAAGQPLARIEIRSADGC